MKTRGWPRHVIGLGVGAGLRVERLLGARVDVLAHPAMPNMFGNPETNGPGLVRLLMLDEPSLGLAPIIVAQVFEEIRNLKAAGTAVLLDEQFAADALAVADRAIVLELGRVVPAGPASRGRHPGDGRNGSSALTPGR
jgi:hypothetical protein